MATLGASNPSLLDLANRMGPDGKVEKSIIEILNQTNGILDDAAWSECNDGSGHKTTVRTGIPDGTWRKLYGGVTQTKSTTVQVRDACGMHENYSTIDKALYDLAGGSAEWRLTEETAFIEGMNQGVASSLFYGDTTINPERFMGIAPRYASSSTATAENADNVIKSDGVGSDNTSIYLVGWHPTTVSMLYPKGSKAGLQVRDLGEQTVYDASNNPLQAMRTHFKWDCGFTVRDWRYVVRVCNIDISNLTKNAATGSDLVDLMTQAVELLPENALAMCRPAFYVGRRVRSFLRRQIRAGASYQLTLETIAGKHVVMFDGIPVRRCDKISEAESLVP